MNSVRLRLLTMALLPLIVLMPLLLVLGMSRWTADYDNVLIANVESDLRIAEQYLARLIAGTGNELEGLAQSASFDAALRNGPDTTTAFLAQKKSELGFDFLYLVSNSDEAAQRWPTIQSAVAGKPDTQIDIFSSADLAAIDPNLAKTARVELIETEAAVPTERIVEDRGMVVHSASPLPLEGSSDILVGGILLNRNLQFIDTINALVYLNAVTGGDRQGTATLFLEDVRVSTNVRLFEDVRALGTRVSAAVRSAVLDEGRTWLNRAFVVNDWYISGYLPISDSFGNRVGMLYVGFLEAPFSAAKKEALLWMIAAFFAVSILAIPLFLWLAKSIFAPLERMSQTMTSVEQGNMSARNGDLGSNDEIAQVAGHLDSLLDQVQDRDRDLRAWADELNQRVDQRTEELRDANQKLESTYKQLVMSEKLASIGEITAGVAHEINNPVAVIQGNVDVIRETLGTNSEPVITELDLIDRQVTRIDAIVAKLLQFARPGEYSGYDEAVALAPVVRDCLVLVEHVISNKNIAVETQLSEDAKARIDVGEIQQILINLIMNAVQSMGDCGTLKLTLAPSERDGKPGNLLTVQDTGPGIPTDKLQSVFDPFFTTKQAEGTGLGLSISQSLVQRAGGLISAQNVPSGGAEFTIWLPDATSTEMAAQ